MQGTQPQMGAAFARIAGVCGLVSVALTVLNVFVLSDGSPPDPSTPARQLAALAAQQRATAELGYYLDAFSTLPLLVFALVLARRAEGDGGFWSTLLFSAAILNAGIDMVWAGCTYAVRELAHVGTSADGVVALFFLSQATLWIIGLPQGLFYAAAGVLALRTRILPAALGWWALALALVAFVATPLTTSIPALNGVIFAVFLLSLVWIVAASIVLLLRAATWSEPAPSRRTGVQPAASGMTA